MLKLIYIFKLKLFLKLYNIIWRKHTHTHILYLNWKTKNKNFLYCLRFWTREHIKVFASYSCQTSNFPPLSPPTLILSLSVSISVCLSILLWSLVCSGSALDINQRFMQSENMHKYNVKHYFWKSYKSQFVCLHVVWIKALFMFKAWILKHQK